MFYLFRGVKFHLPARICVKSKMLYRASKSFDNLCRTFIIYSISGEKVET